MTGMTWEMLERYLSCQCADAERDLVERWLAEESSRQIIARFLSDATAPAEISCRAVWISLHRRLTALAAGPFQRPRGTRLVLVRLVAWATLAGGAMLAAREVLRQSSPGTSAAAPVRVATTPPGQRATLHLADGTRVMLGVASSLRSPAEFGAGPREVELTGEAYFEVAPDEHRPFIVRAADVVARDVGTSFLVRAYPEDRHARIVVREGSVAMRAVGDPDTARMSLITPGHVGRLAADGTPVVEPSDTAAEFSWIEGRLTIDSLPLREALPQLGRWYDLDFRLSDSALGAVPLTATLGSRLSPDLLDLLARSLGMRQERTGRTVTLYPANAVH